MSPSSPSSRSTESLFRPFQLKSLELPSRIVMAPMTRNHSPNGVPGDDVAEYYARRAGDAVGLILSEGTVVDRPAAKNHPSIPDLHGEAALDGWTRTVDAVHGAGGRIGAQVWHVGAMPDPGTDWTPPGEPESPSGRFINDDIIRGRSMTDDDVAGAIEAFADAARNAQACGFDMIEIHAAHGYLIDQFFWDVTNQRSDRFGGADLASRTAFAVEVVSAIREAVGPDYPVGMRISQWKMTDFAARLVTSPDEIERWLGPLRDAGVDIFHASQRRFNDAEFPEIDGENGLNLAGWIKKLTGAPTITVGSIGIDSLLGSDEGMRAGPAPLDDLIERLERDEFDLVAVGRALLADPQWATKIKSNATDQLVGVDDGAFVELR